MGKLSSLTEGRDHTAAQHRRPYPAFHPVFLNFLAKLAVATGTLVRDRLYFDLCRTSRTVTTTKLVYGICPHGPRSRLRVTCMASLAVLCAVITWTIDLRFPAVHGVRGGVRSRVESIHFSARAARGPKRGRRWICSVRSRFRESGCSQKVNLVVRTRPDNLVPALKKALFLLLSTL